MSSFYIHWPFCISKCNYCDFNSVVCKDVIDFDYWLSLYKKIIIKFKDEYYKSELIESIYFGGGTPSLLPTYFIDNIISFIKANFKVDDNLEITLESNPKTLNKQKAIDLKKAGINRLSIGVQSIIDIDLKILGRIHNSKDAIECIYYMNDIFENISIDIIYNRPKQNIENWKNELKQILKLPIKHISLYELIIEDNTPIKYMIENGELPNQKDNYKFMRESINIAEENNFKMYEISNFALNGDVKYQSKHNLLYWKYKDYYGIGPGSHSRVTKNNKKIAISQICDIKKWLNWAEENPKFDEEILSNQDEFKEILIMGLRTTYGVNMTKMRKKIKNYTDFKKKIEKLKENSYIIEDRDRLFLTKQGVFRLNLIIKYLSGV